MYIKKKSFRGIYLLIILVTPYNIIIITILLERSRLETECVNNNHRTCFINLVLKTCIFLWVKIKNILVRYYILFYNISVQSKYNIDFKVLIKLYYFIIYRLAVR